MNEIDVTKVSAIEYLEKLIEISNEEKCEWFGCNTCKFQSLSCATPDDIEDIGIEEHIKNVMTFKLSEPEIDWTKVEKDTLIEVKDFETDDWIKRYFAYYYNGQVFAYINGCTSKTETSVAPWGQARIVESDQ